jgi:GNAT superfamily N-acetyltransferase
MRVSLRPASSGDFDFCAKLYFGGREQAIEESGLDMGALVADLRERWEVTQVRIITLENRDIGWLQTRIEDDATPGRALFVVQLFIDSPFQGQGIGTEVMHRIIQEARAAGQAVTLGVVKSNPALRLYTRLGFQITHEDERKFYMRRDSDRTST